MNLARELMFAAVIFLAAALALMPLPIMVSLLSQPREKIVIEHTRPAPEPAPMPQACSVDCDQTRHI